MSDERKVQEVLARYVRATDRRDGKTQGGLFTDEAVVQIYTKTGPDSYEPFGEPLIGGAGVEYAVTNFMSAHPEGGCSHHTTLDHIIDVDGDHAHLNAQFIVYRVQASARPAEGSPAGVSRCPGHRPADRVRVLRHGSAPGGRRVEDRQAQRADGHADRGSGSMMKAMVYRHYGGRRSWNSPSCPSPRPMSTRSWYGYGPPR